MAPFYLLAGEKFGGLSLAAVVLAAVCLIAVVVLCAEGVRGVWPVAIATVGFLARYDVERLRDPWNPYLVVFPTALSLVLAACVISGRHRRLCLLALVVTASFAVQTHVGSAPVILAAAAVAVASTLPRFTGGNRRETVTLLAGVGCVGFAAWFLPLYEEVTRPKGNLGRVVHFAIAGGSSTHPFGASVKLVVDALALSPNQMGVRYGPASPFIAPIQLSGLAAVTAGGVVILAGLGCWLAWRAHRLFQCALSAMGLLGAVVSVIAIHQAAGPLEPYLLTPVLGVALVLWISAAMAVANLIALRPSHRPSRRITPVLAGLALLAVTFLATRANAGASQRSLSRQTSDPSIAAMVEATRRYCTHPSKDVTVSITSGPWYEASGLIVSLARCGQRVHVSTNWAFVFGSLYSTTIPLGQSLAVTAPNSPVPDGWTRLVTTATTAVDAGPPPTTSPTE
jgi:hypothetical protein